MRRSIGIRLSALGVAVLLCGATALCATAWLGSRSRTRSPAGPGSSIERIIARAQRLLKEGKPRDALQEISGVASDGPQAAEILLVEGLARVALGESEPARQALLRSVASRPDQPMAFKVLAAIAFSRSEDQRGIEYLARAASLDPGDFRPLYAIGEVHIRRGRMDAAIRAFEAALLRKSDHAESRIGLLTASLAIRPPEGASDMVRELLRDYPYSPQAQVLAARHSRALGDAESALRFAGRAIELDPDSVEALVLRSHLLYITGEKKSALNEAVRAVEHDPSNPQALAILAQLQAAVGQVEKSRATQARRQEIVAQSERMLELTDQIAQHPDDPVPRWQLGQNAAANGARSLATESYRAALNLDPECQPALAGLRSLQELSPLAVSTPHRGARLPVLPMSGP
jgi:tetratricopeptide (TPR) repeat protein